MRGDMKKIEEALERTPEQLEYHDFSPEECASYQVILDYCRSSLRALPVSGEAVAYAVTQGGKLWGTFVTEAQAEAYKKYWAGNRIVVPLYDHPAPVIGREDLMKVYKAYQSVVRAVYSAGDIPDKHSEALAIIDRALGQAQAAGGGV